MIRAEKKIKEGDDIFMRLFVFFDLPVYKKEQRRAAERFKKELRSNGFWGIQSSVYCRCCRGLDIVDREIRRLKQTLPPGVNLRVLQVTDKQYGNMQLLIGAPIE